MENVLKEWLEEFNKNLGKLSTNDKKDITSIFEDRINGAISGGKSSLAIIKELGDASVAAKDVLEGLGIFDESMNKVNIKKSIIGDPKTEILNSKEIAKDILTSLPDKEERNESRVKAGLKPIEFHDHPTLAIYSVLIGTTTVPLYGVFYFFAIAVPILILPWAIVGAATGLEPIENHIQFAQITLFLISNSGVVFLVFMLLAQLFYLPSVPILRWQWKKDGSRNIPQFIEPFSIFRHIKMIFFVGFGVICIVALMISMIMTNIEGAHDITKLFNRFG